MMRMLFCTLIAMSAVALAAPGYAKDGELHSFHCYGGCPLGAPATNDTVVREIYTLSSNDLTKMADWVAYRITPKTVGPSENRNWSPDRWLNSEETLVEQNYDEAPATLHIDRGHQAPLAALAGTGLAQETNILSNITPQASALNQGPWNRLEARERQLVGELNGPVYVYTGPLFERVMRPMPQGPDYHRVPSGYWKVIVTPNQRMSVFLMDQNTGRSASHCDSRVPLREVELRSRLYLFPLYDVSGFGSLDAALGCPTVPPSRPPGEEISTR